jgi:carbon monoxide dehydrogenase subunit G
MLGLLTRHARSPRTAPRRFRPNLERLETRDCPAGPVIATFTATNTTGTVVQLTGTVTDPNPASVSINFSGVMSGSTTADANGNFSFTANAAGLGTVNAVGTDSQQLQSNTAQAQVTCPKPTLTLNWDLVTQNEVLLYGKVTAPTASGLTVTLTGVVSGTTVSDANGDFSVTLNASGVGNVSATLADVWNQVSNPASVTVSEPPPSFDSFKATNTSGTTWTFSGVVCDETPAGNTVSFSGTPSVSGKTCKTQNDGSFSLTITLQQGEEGTEEVICTDWFNLNSQPDYYVLSY